MESARAITPPKMNKNQKPHAYLHIIRKQYTKFQINPTKDVEGVAGTRFRMEGRKDGRRKDGCMHIQADEDHFYSPPSAYIRGQKDEFETVVLNEPSVFESLKFY